MGKSIDIDKSHIVEISGADLILTITKDDQDRMLVHVESEKGGKRILISQHEEDSKTIVFEAEKPAPPKPKLSLVR